MTTQKRQLPLTRKKQLLDAAIQLSLEIGYQKISAVLIAKNTGVTRGLVHHYLGNIKNIKKSIMKNAIQKDLEQIVLQGISINDPTALKALNKLKPKILKYLNLK